MLEAAISPSRYYYTSFYQRLSLALLSHPRRQIALYTCNILVRAYVAPETPDEVPSNIYDDDFYARAHSIHRPFSSDKIQRPSRHSSTSKSSSSDDATAPDATASAAEHETEKGTFESLPRVPRLRLLNIDRSHVA